MNNRALWQDIPRKKQGIIFVISYYCITIASEPRYLQGITRVRVQILAEISIQLSGRNNFQNPPYCLWTFPIRVGKSKL